MNSVIDQIMSHRSIRKFKDTPLTSEQMNTIISAAQMAPNSSDNQCYSIIGITDREIKREIREFSRMSYVEDNGHLLIFCADLHRVTIMASQMEKLAMENALDSQLYFQIAVQDATLAAQNASLAAESLGLGTVFIGGIASDLPKLDSLLQLPDRVIPLFALAIGIPDQEPESKPRLPMQAIYHENQYNTEQQGFIEEYNNTMSNYWAQRADNKKSATWSEQAITIFTKSTWTKFITAYFKKKKVARK